MKMCKRCEARKDDDKFHRLLVNGRFYRQTYCKLCQRVLSRERYRKGKA